ncbi:MAG: enoyl-CoA hydratase/isomerase family protein [Trueperaceae bacterium]|nr:enoyl-CoA hydratase/isomerase family protein [Trueperaceae bacterium]MCC6310150.1 enoyl-CoA hydratase/isomerase family protein [Trueperaceae bacterium]MCO5172800.1 enoyl-CoA hydratase-related protein [Trueperaceae bacterium]MCW5819946.1 enoyl-CoA hydratase/isomerase family protein [Trueperaceae bacterium]
MTYRHLTLTERDGALRVALDRPEVLNALDLELLAELADALTGPAAEPRVRAVLLTGTGRAFCAGADLGSTAMDADIGMVLEEYYHPVVRAVAALEKPVVAGVNGVAAGAGLSLAAACDVRIAANSATFALGFTGIGLALDAGSSYFLSRLIGPGRTLELAFGNRRVDAAEALRIGLVERVLDGPDFAEEVMGIARALAGGPTLAYALVKAEVRAALDNTLSEQLAFEAEAQARAGASDDAREGIRAFAEKRAPRYGGR